MSEQDLGLNQIDDDTLIGHFMLAGIERRFDDHQALGDECVARGLYPEGAPERLEQELRDRQKVSR